MIQVSSEIEQQLRSRLTSALLPIELIINDESHLHAGHAGSANGARHFFVRIVSKQFQGIKRLEQHRLVYAAVNDLMPHPIHALRMDTQSTFDL